MDAFSMSDDPQVPTAPVGVASTPHSADTVKKAAPLHPDAINQMSDAELQQAYSDQMAADGKSFADVDAEAAAAKQEQVKQQVAKIKAEFNNDQIANNLNRTEAGVENIFNPQNQESGANVQLGIGLGIRNLLRKGYNGLVDLASGITTYAASKGYGTGDFVTQAAKISQNAKDIQIGGINIGLGEGDVPDKSPATKIAQTVTEIAAPMALSIAATGGATSGVALDSVMSFLLTDQDSSNLISKLKNTPLAEAPIAAELVDHLATKPDDSLMTRRLKMAAETGLMGAAVADAGVMVMGWGASRVANAAERAKTPGTIGDAEQLVNETNAAAKAPKTEAPVPTASGEAVPPTEAPLPPSQTDTISTNTAAAEAVPSTPQVATPAKPIEPGEPVEYNPASNNTPEQLGLFDKQWALMEGNAPAVSVDKATGEIKNVKLTDDQVLEHFYDLANSVKDVKVLRTPLTDDELFQAAGTIKNDSDTINRLATWTPAKGVLDDKDTIVLKYLLAQADTKFGQVIDETVKNIDDPMQLIKFQRSMENYYRMNEITQGAASAKGATLRAEQLTAQAAGLGQKEAMQAIGAAGRAQLQLKLVESYGGPSVMQDTARKIAFLKQAADIAAVPNEAFKNMNGQIALRTGMDSVRDAVTKVMLNSLLSVSSVGKAIVTNAVTTTKTIADNYLAASIPGGKATFQEANAHLNATFSALLDSVAPAISAYKRPAGFVTEFRAGLEEGVGRPISQSDAVRRQFGAFAQMQGIGNAILTAPARALISTDVYWNRVNEAAYIRLQGLRSGQALVDSGQMAKEGLNDYISSYEQNPSFSVLKAAKEAAGANTMSKPLTGQAADISTGIQQAADVLTLKIGLGKAVAPFLTSKLNSIEYNIVNSPLGVFAPQVRAALQGGGRERDVAIAKMVSGTVGLSSMVYLANQGKVFGGYSADAQLNKALPTGTAESSVQVADGKYLSVKGIEPLAFLVNVGHLINKASGYATEGQLAEVAHAAMGVAGETLEPETLSDGISDMMKLMNQDTKSGAAQALLANLAIKYTPFSGSLKTIKNIVDPTTRDTHYDSFFKMAAAKFQGIVPWYSKDLPPTRDMFGNKVTLPDGIGPDVISPIVSLNDETKAIRDNYDKMERYAQVRQGNDSGLMQFKAEMPPRIVSVSGAAGTSVQLSPEQYSNYLLARGGRDPMSGAELPSGLIQKNITQIFNKYKFNDQSPTDMDPTKYVQMLSEVKVQHMMMEKNGMSYLMRDPSFQQQYRQGKTQGFTMLGGQQ